jgi:signal peptidase I
MSQNAPDGISSSAPAKPPFKLRARRFLNQTLWPLAIVIVVLTSFRSAIADWNDVPTGSMKPTILEGDRIFVNKLAYGLKVPFTTWHLARWDAPKRGEIVVFNSPSDGVRLVKRVVGVPGDQLQMIDNRLFINGRPVDYERVDQSFVSALPASERSRHAYATEQLGAHPHPVMITPWAVAQRSFGPVAVPPGHYYMLGDNRDNSSDSRVFKFVHEDQIVGRSSRVAMSLDYDNHFLPRWDRFFKALP